MTPEEAINLLQEVDNQLLDLNVLVSLPIEYNNLEDYTDTSDNVDRCLDMVAGQIQEAWIHAERALQRLYKLQAKHLV